MGVGYDLFIEPEVHEFRKSLPGNVRQRIRRVLDSLVVEPRPANGRRLTLTEDEIPSGVEIWRVRLDRWRIVYAVNDADRWVHVLGIYRRPPYDYGDLPELIERLAP
jgi:mRNA interferase RelE/StbE